MRDGGPPFSVVDFIWEEIKGISMNPQKTCEFVPYIMFMIEDVTNRIFSKDGSHVPIRPTPSEKTIAPPPLHKSPLLQGQILHHYSKEQQNRSDQQGIPVRPVEVIRGSLLHSSEKNHPIPTRRCLGSYLACVALTMPSRRDCMRKKSPQEALKGYEGGQESSLSKQDSFPFRV
jgi:hypothetical protein